MSCNSEYSRLCRLIDGYLSPYNVSSTESEAVSLGEGKEKGLLVALSQVLREIKLCTQGLDHSSDNDLAAKPDGEKKCSGGSKPHDKEHHCLTKSIADLIVLLTVESQYVQHLASNILVVISEFVVASGSNWDVFINFLCVCMELAVTYTLSYSSAPSTTGAGVSNFDLSSVIVVLKPRLKNANWSTVAGIIRILRNILKYLKQEYDDQLVEVYLNSVNSCLSNVPWYLLDEIHFGQNCNTPKSSCVDALHCRKTDGQEPRVMFLGHFVQFLCSLVELTSSGKVSDVSLDAHPILFEIINLIPKLICWSIGKQGDCDGACISQYFRHKILVLMIRLSFQSHLECTVLVSWLQLLHLHFGELLGQPITQLESGQDDCLDGSPFLLSVAAGDVHNVCSRHLQRLAVFLFLRCSFSLISLRGDTDKRCACATPNSCLTLDSISDLEYCCRQKGLLELYKWLQGHLPTDMFVNHEIYTEKCMNFASSFLQLYMHEDDVLFKVLLQLLSIPYCAEQQFHKEKRIFQDAEKEILFHVSNLFNPIYLFHLFLAELHYDHQVLLDYLISKDTGISCAEYLLRCLRTVCDSWDLFVEFLVGEKVINQSPRKKRKVPLGSSFQAELSSPPVKSILPPLEKELQRDLQYGCKQYRIGGQPFKEARDCLLSLKNSLENLHQKNLFPYNPAVLLKRLTRFQELCFKQENYCLSKNGGTS